MGMDAGDAHHDDACVTYMYAYHMHHTAVAGGRLGMHKESQMGESGGTSDRRFIVCGTVARKKTTLVRRGERRAGLFGWQHSETQLLPRPSSALLSPPLFPPRLWCLFCFYPEDQPSIIRARLQCLRASTPAPGFSVLNRLAARRRPQPEPFGPPSQPRRAGRRAARDTARSRHGPRWKKACEKGGRGEATIMDERFAIIILQRVANLPTNPRS
jgi:hypothetical protein